MAVDRRLRIGVLNGNICWDATVSGPEPNSLSITFVLTFVWSITIAIRLLYKLQYGCLVSDTVTSISLSVESSVCNASKSYTELLLSIELSNKIIEFFDATGLCKTIISSDNESFELQLFNFCFDLVLLFTPWMNEKHWNWI